MNMPFTFSLQLTWKVHDDEYAPFVELKVEGCVFVVLIRHLTEFSKYCCLYGSYISYFFSSFYPILQYILYPSLPHRLYQTLQSSPLLSAFQSIHLQPAVFTQPPPRTVKDFISYCNTWPVIEATFNNVAIHLPIQSSNHMGVVVDIGAGQFYTHKPGDASVPVGSFIRTGKSWAELKGATGITYTHEQPYRLISNMDDSLIFPRFIVDVWSTRIYSTESDHLVSDNLDLSVVFRPKVVLPTEPENLMEEVKKMPSEQHLLRFFPRFSPNVIPNAVGLPMEVSIETESFQLDLLQSQYNELLLFFFLNLGEIPAVCKNPYTPQCTNCKLYHDPLLHCDDCWCVFRILAERFILYPTCGIGNSLVPLNFPRLSIETTRTTSS